MIPWSNRHSSAYDTSEPFMTPVMNRRESSRAGWLLALVFVAAPMLLVAES